MAILQFHQASGEPEPEVLEIIPESNREIVVIHSHPRPSCVDKAILHTPIGLQVMYRLVELLRGWPESLSSGLNCVSIPDRKRNGEFLEKLISDVRDITQNFRAQSVIDEAALEDLCLSERLVFSLLLMSVNPHPFRMRNGYLVCGSPLEDTRRFRNSPTNVELCSPSSSGGYWTLMSVSLYPGFVDGYYKLCPVHEQSLSKVFNKLIARGEYTRPISESQS